VERDGDVGPVLGVRLTSPSLVNHRRAASRLRSGVTRGS
jgi:hypothetical protein